jgi:hypothetical protein
VTGSVALEHMTQRFAALRCLHDGPLSPSRTDDWSRTNAGTPWRALRQRNVTLLLRLTSAIGSCAVFARVNDEVVGIARLYPKAVAIRVAATDAEPFVFGDDPIARAVREPGAARGLGDDKVAVRHTMRREPIPLAFV